MGLILHLGFCSLGLGFRHLQTDVFKELVVQVSITANGDLAKVMGQLEKKKGEGEGGDLSPGRPIP